MDGLVVYVATIFQSFDQKKKVYCFTLYKKKKKKKNKTTPKDNIKGFCEVSLFSRLVQ